MSIKDFLTISSACPASWDEMEGDEKTRFCSLCSLSVHNLAVMDEEEVSALLAGSAASGERLCGQLYLRADGMVQSADCPRGLARIRESSRALYKKVAAVFALACGLSSLSPARSDDRLVQPMIRGKVSALAPWEMTVEGNGPEKTLQEKLAKMDGSGQTSSKEFLDCLYQLALLRKQQAEKAATQEARLQGLNRSLSCLFYLQNLINQDPVTKKMNEALLKKVESLIETLRKPQAGAKSK